MRYHRDYTILYMLHMAEEAELMLNNLIPYLQYEYGDEVLEYFTEAAKKEAKDYCWDKENQKVICATNIYTEEEEIDKLGIE